jgi:hypothetical protein
MRVAIRPISKTSGEALALDEIRVRLEQRLLAAHEAWDLERKRLEEAMARAEAKEREFRETAEDVKHRMEALDLVAGMARDLEGPSIPPGLPEPPAPAVLPEPAALAGLPEPATTPQQLQMIDEKQRAGLRLPASSRPLFSQEVRAGLFSILR